MKVTAQLYGQFLVSSQVNYTGTYLADHLEGLTHDNVRYFLKTSHFTPRQLWQQVRAQVVFSARGYVLFDDTVLDKHHSRRIELVRRQYSGNAHGVIAGIGLVTCVYVNPETDQFWLIDYRLFAPDTDGKTKLDHVADMLEQLAPRGIPYRTVLMDSWYATTALFKWLLQAEKTFYCPLKSNRLVDDSGGRQPYQPVGCLNWSNAEVEQGKVLKVKEMPKDCKLKLFRVLVSTHRTDYLLTNEVAPHDAAAAEHESSVRWTIEQFHRERKQLTGVQACQYRLARSQRNHIALAVRAWTRLKQAAYQTQKTVYQLKQGFLDAYMRHELLSQPWLLRKSYTNWFTVDPLPGAVVINGPRFICTSSGSLTFTIPNASAGSTFQWTVTGGTITAGQGTVSIVVSFPAGTTATKTFSVIGLRLHRSAGSHHHRAR